MAWNPNDLKILLPHFPDVHMRVMVFVDGENFAIRYQCLMAKKHMENCLIRSPLYEPDVFVWSDLLNDFCRYVKVIRKHYYTSVSGDEKRIRDIEDKMKEAGIEAPHVFRKDKRKRSKQVDISLATDMLTQAHRKNYDIAILIAGDGDYVPLIEAVKAEGSLES
jgi:uncharacterized LabA/DUF88 family protein